MNLLLQNYRSKLVLILALTVASLSAGVSPALAQSTDDGWRTTIYPVYGWLPIYGAEIRLPEIPNPPPCDGCGDGGPIVPGGNVSSNLNGAAFAAVVVENKWVQGEANFLWAGLSADAERPNLKVEVDTVMANARLGVRVVPNLFVYGGVRHIGLNIKATALVFDEVQWKPECLGRTRGRVLHAAPVVEMAAAGKGGLWRCGRRRPFSYSATAALEWQPLRHLVVDLGYGFFQITVDGTLSQKPIHLEQTTHGPIIGIGIPF